jgi:hypothetical protein
MSISAGPHHFSGGGAAGWRDAAGRQIARKLTRVSLTVCRLRADTDGRAIEEIAEMLLARTW